MAIFSKGADPEALEQSANRLSGYATEYESVRTVTGEAVRSLTGQWAGGDLVQLLSRWPGVEHHLTACSTDLGALAESLRRNARMQGRTSSGAPNPAAPNPVAPNPVAPDPTGAGGGGGGGDFEHPSNPEGNDDTGDYVPLTAPVPTTDADFDPTDIHQGQIGDCWLLSALGVIGVNDPDFIRSHMAYDPSTNSYNVILYDDGEPVTVTVDASTVEHGEKGPGGQATWVSIYEKAVASYSGGSYDDIDGGWSDDAMELITGRDTESHDDMSLDDIRQGLDGGRVYAAGTENGDTWNPFDDEIDDNRVVPNHAYMVDTVEMHDGQQMIHLVNPWGPDGGHMEGDSNFKWGDLWLTEQQYHESFSDTFGMQEGLVMGEDGLMDEPDETGTEAGAETVRAKQGSQPTLAGVRIGIVRAGLKKGIPTAQLLLRSEDATEVVFVPEGDSVDLLGHGTLTVAGVHRSPTPQGRSEVTLTWSA